MGWIALLSSIGLVSLMVLPAPGIWGLGIGVACCLAITLWALLWLLDRLAARLLRVVERRVRRRRRAMHAGSGMIRRAGTPPAPAPPAPARFSPIQERARLAALRRQAGRQEPFRVR